MAKINNLKNSIEKMDKIRKVILFCVGAVFLCALVLTLCLIKGASFTLSSAGTVQPWIGAFFMFGVFFSIAGLIIYFLIDVKISSKTKKYNNLVDDYNEGNLDFDNEEEQEQEISEKTKDDSIKEDTEDISAKNQAPIINTKSGIQFEYYKGNHEMILMSVKKIKL